VKKKYLFNNNLYQDFVHTCGFIACLKILFFLIFFYFFKFIFNINTLMQSKNIKKLI
jgi:hypothetical protein